jgi:hypothetical protein
MKKAIPFILLILMLLPIQASAAPSNATIPSSVILDVEEDDSVTIKVYNFPVDDTLKVTMGNFGTRGVGGIVVDTQNSGSGTFSATYAIPNALKDNDLIAIRLESPYTGYYAYDWFWNNDNNAPIPGSSTTSPLPAGKVPTFGVSKVNEDKNVTINPKNFPANDTFKVRMGDYGTRGVGGVLVETVTSDAGGDLSDMKFKIPPSLYGLARIAIRLESPSSGYYAYNWFYNSTGSTSSSSSSSGSSSTVTPTFTIANVNTDKNVTINPKNFPANETFKVRMGVYGTQAVGGEVVETVTSDSDGDLSDTKYKIPASLAGDYRIAIRLESTTSGYYSYNWFYNDTSSSSTGTGGLPAGTYPTFYISAVDKDDDVTITPYNFTANDEYTVRMGPMGTRGVGGTVVDTVSTNANGKLDTTTFDIPASLVGSYQIAIRLESNSTGYYAYNWFYNNDHP